MVDIHSCRLSFSLWYGISLHEYSGKFYYLLNHSSVDVCVDNFQFLGIRNSAFMNFLYTLF